jgi:hypothetical protein
MKFHCFFHILLVLLCITVYIVVCFARFYLILYIMYFYCYVYVFLLLCMFRSRYCVSLCCCVYCLCVNVHCTTASYQIYHIISHHIHSFIQYSVRRQVQRLFIYHIIYIISYHIKRLHGLQRDNTDSIFITQAYFSHFYGRTSRLKNLSTFMVQ